jgi:hypothetical protein
MTEHDEPIEHRNDRPRPQCPMLAAVKHLPGGYFLKIAGWASNSQQ